MVSLPSEKAPTQLYIVICAVMSLVLFRNAFKALRTQTISINMTSYSRKRTPRTFWLFFSLMSGIGLLFFLYLLICVAAWARMA